MATIKQRFKEIVYKKITPQNKDLIPKNEEIVFFICEELKEEDFKKPFFNSLINLGDGFKFLSYCGKEQNKNINKNAIVIQKKLKKDNKVIYRVYLMDKDNFKIRDLFLKYSNAPTIAENNYSLRASDYIMKIKETYTKKEIIYIINKSLNDLIEWSLKQ